MEHHSRDRETPRLSALQVVGILGYDALATAFGLYGALLIDLRGDVPVGARGMFRAALPGLLIIRFATIYAAGLHRWSFRRSGSLDAARLVLSGFVASAGFALAFRGLPASVYVLEGFLTTTLMAAFRFLSAIADEYDRTRLPQAEADFVAAERPRRALNFLVALAGLVLTLPAWVLIAIAIKLTSRGPVLYKQERIGLDLRASRPRENDPRRRRDLGGRPFMMYKFRTMRADAEAGTGAVWSAKDDPRVTPIGRVLRHCRLDELPQLVNVLKGDMNVVGPRPERASIFADLRSKIPDYPVRQRARPGITGYAQVHLEYDSSIEDVADKLRYDVEYVQRQSVSMDLRIMAKTLPVMLFRDKMLMTRDRRTA